MTKSAGACRCELTALADLATEVWPLLQQRGPAQGRPHSPPDGLLCSPNEATGD